MEWSDFLSGLFEHGRLVVPPVEPLSRDDLAALGTRLSYYESLHRKELPGNMPAWNVEAGTWAGAMLFRGCQFALFRDLGEQELKLQLDGEPPESSPESHYSVDLCFQYLPDLIAFARSASEGDPLVTRMMAWAANWPLSSVGVPAVQVKTEVIDQLAETRPLWTLYIDRILERDDTSRLDHLLVMPSIEQALGDYPDLAPPGIRRRTER